MNDTIRWRTPLHTYLPSWNSPKPNPGNDWGLWKQEDIINHTETDT